MTDRDDVNRDSLSRGRAHRPSRQLDPGTYTVYSRSRDNEPQSGMVFVEGQGSMRIEHWVLSEKHTSPTAQNDFLVKQSDETYSSLPTFLDAMRQRAAAWERVTYIKAICEELDEIPTL